MAKSKEPNYLQVTIYSPEGEVYSHRATSCRIHTTDGYMTVLANHIPVIAALDISPVIVQRLSEDALDYVAIDGGVVTFNDNQLDIVATYAVRARDIDAAGVEIQKNKAEADMQAAKTQEDTVAYRRARIQLNRAINQITVSQYRR